MKREYFQTPKPLTFQTPTPEGFTCLELTIPDDPVYANIIQGLYAQICQQYNWQGEPEERAIRAQLCEEAYTLTDWSMCMDCSGVADCIENDEGVREALHEFNQQDSNGNTPGEKNAPSKLNENLTGSNPGCDNDTAWGNIRTGLVDRSFQRVIDFLEKVQVTTNNQDMLADALNSIPVLGEVLGIVGVSSWIAFYDDIRDWLADAFTAQDTTDLRDAIACDLFCIWQNECSLSVQQIRDYYVGKLTVDFPTLAEALAAGIVELATALGALIEDVSDFSVYIMLAAEYGFVAEINDWFGITIQASKSDMLIGEPSNDWADLCEDCPDAFPILLFDAPINFGGTQQSSEDFQNDTEVNFAAFNPSAGRYELCLYAPNGDYTQVMSISSGTPTPIGTEIVWLYTDLSDATQFGTGATDTCADFPTPVDVRMEQGSNLKCSWWSSGTPFSVTVKLTRL